MPLNAQLETKLKTLKQEGTYKQARHLNAPMAGRSHMAEIEGEVTILSSNNYLGLANHPQVVSAAKEALDTYGAGTASVRFICGTMTIHEALEEKLARLHRTHAALTYSSCFAANGGLFPIITSPGDVILSDALNHASIIDGCRLVQKGVIREVYEHSNMDDLERLLVTHHEAPQVFIVTDGVFSMEGDLANLPRIVALKEKYGATLIVDDSHGVGVMGKTGRGTAEHFGVMEKIDITTGTLGKALGGAAGGYVAGPKSVVDMLFQASRPQIFSNGISPATAGGAIAAIDVMLSQPHLLEELHAKTRYLRDGLVARGFSPLSGESAIVPIIVGETAKAIAMSDALLKKGFFVTGFGFPVVPEGEARIRVQLSTDLSEDDLDRALAAFEEVGKAFDMLP